MTQAPGTYPADHAVKAVEPAKAAAGWDEPVAWRMSINYGPDGEANYANVYDETGELVGNLKVHHAHKVVAAAHPVESEVADLRAEVERLTQERDDAQTEAATAVNQFRYASKVNASNWERAEKAEAALAFVKEELASTLEELIDHNGDSLDDARANRVRELRSPAALSTHDADRAGDAGESR